jgi:ribonuclease HI
VPLTAKYRTTCAVCSQVIPPGTEISKSPTGWAHTACAAQTPALIELGAESGLQPAFGGSVAATPTRRIAKSRPADMPAPAGALEVWTDGACSGNPGPGGWAWATKDGRRASGGSPATTNQRMEIQAALEAVTALGSPLVVVSDSTYVVNCFRDAWWKGWIARGWQTSAKKPVANRDLWEPLITAVNERGGISFRWVKGHSGDEMNDLVDQLAVEAGRLAAVQLRP